MKDINSREFLTADKTVVAMGVFDGIHLGHKSVLEKAVSYEEYGLIPSVFTFRTESIASKHGKEYKYLMTDREKHSALEQLGIRYIYSPDFSELKELNAETFASEILKKKMKAEMVVCGPSFHFGKGAVCGANELADMGKKYGFDVSVAQPFIIDNTVVSSSEIKRLISCGDIKKASLFSGRSYSITQKISHGNEIGRKLNFPTINQYFSEGRIIPAYGVYFSSVNINGRKYNSLTNIGIRPTVADRKEPLAETHILDFSGDLYGKILTVELRDFIRSEQCFNSLDDLRKQINSDIIHVKSIGG